MSQLKGEAKRRYVADLFSRIAPRYDLMNTLMTGGLHHHWRRLAVRAATAGLARLDGMALDVATGTGDLALALAAAPSARRTVGLDFLPEMVARAQAKTRRRGTATKVEVIVGDGLCLPFADATFVCATSGWGLRNMPDPRRCMEEMVRVVQPGGRVVSLESLPVRTGPFALPFRLFFHHVVPLLGQLIAGDRAAYTYLPRSVDGFMAVQDLARLFEDVGLTEVGYRRMGFGVVAVHWGTKPA